MRPGDTRTLLAGGLTVEVRPLTVDDLPRLIAFIRAMAAFERLTVSATEASLRDALFGDEPAARALLALVEGRPVAYAVYYFSFSTMEGRRGLWLDDLFVDEAYRKQGVGQALMALLADIAVEHGCARFEWAVLDWNAPAIRFYERLGAVRLSDWYVYRLDGERLARAAESLGSRPGA